MKKTILCVDDIRTNLFTLQSVIESLADEKYNVVIAQSASEGLTVLLKQKVDLILLDVMMPDIDGFEMAGMLKSNKKTKDIPIIFVTANKDDATIERCYECGGSDYVNKPFNHVELLARIAFHLSLQDKERELKERETELTHEANFDSLTQVYNRNMFQRLIKRKITDAQSNQKTFVLIMIDIDYFKKINDNFGHLVGDTALKNLVKSIQSHIRDNDLFARWGGEEFILCFDVDMQTGLKISENLRKSVEIYDFDTIKSMTCSFGITEFKNNDGIDSMIKRADDALYEAKRSGRNRVCQA